MGDKQKNAQKALGDLGKNLSQNTFAKQMVGGALAGWVTGHFAVRVGKPAALTIGCGILLYQIAEHNNLLGNMDFHKLKETAEKQSSKLQSPNILKVKSFATKNKIFSVSFVGGLLIGLAT